MSETLIGLGRIHAPDSRDLNYPLRTAAAPRTSKYWLSLGPVLDQGATSQCVAYSIAKYLSTHPVVNKLPMTPQEFYRECQRNDEWPGEEPQYFGTSVRAAFRILQRLGYVPEYRWAFDVETVVNHLLQRGPVVMGTNWTRDMFMPDRHGFITDSGQIDGGHAYLLLGANRRKKNPLTGEVGAVRMLNSWGRGWGQGGRAWISFSVLGRLIAARGEACVASEVKRP